MYSASLAFQSRRAHAQREFASQNGGEGRRGGGGGGGCVEGEDTLLTPVVFAHSVLEEQLGQLQVSLPARALSLLLSLSFSCARILFPHYIFDHPVLES